MLVHGTCELGGHYPGQFWNASNLGVPDREAYGFHTGCVITGFPRRARQPLNVKIR